MAFRSSYPSTFVPTIWQHEGGRGHGRGLWTGCGWRVMARWGRGRACGHQVEAPRVLVRLYARHPIPQPGGTSEPSEDFEPELDPLPPVPLLQRVDDAQPVFARTLELLRRECTGAMLLLSRRPQPRHTRRAAERHTAQGTRARAVRDCGMVRAGRVRVVSPARAHGGGHHPVGRPDGTMLS
jgi:hypothetical protein